MTGHDGTPDGHDTGRPACLARFGQPHETMHGFNAETVRYSRCTLHPAAATSVLHHPRCPSHHDHPRHPRPWTHPTPPQRPPPPDRVVWFPIWSGIFGFPNCMFSLFCILVSFVEIVVSVIRFLRFCVLVFFIGSFCWDLCFCAF